MDAGEGAFADGEDERALCEDAVQVLVVNGGCAVARGLQGEPPGGDAIGEVGVVLGEVFRVDVAGSQVKATADEYVLRETAYETAVLVVAVEVRRIGRAVDHDAT